MLAHYPGGDLILIDKPSVWFYAHVVYYYDTNFYFDQLHLLEHLLLNPDRILPTKKVEAKSLLAGLWDFNGFTGGAFISFDIQINKPCALPMLQVLWEMLQAPLQLRGEDVAQELFILQQEETFQAPLYGFNVQRIEQLYDPHPFFSMLNPESMDINQIQQMHQQIIRQVKPLVIIHAALADSDVQEATNWMKTTLLHANKKSFTHCSPETFPKYLARKVDFFSARLRKVGLYFVAEVYQTSQRVLNKLVLEFLREAWFEYLRYVEGSDYDIQSTHRFMFYGWQMGLSFHTKLPSDELQDLMEQMFYKKAADFRLMQQKIFHQMMLLNDKPIHSYYYLMQEYAFTGTYRPIYELANDMKNITFKEFKTHYQVLLGQMSVLILE